MSEKSPFRNRTTEIIDNLGISQNFYREHRATVLHRLNEAYELSVNLEKKSTKIMESDLPVQRCIHTAISFKYVGSTYENMRKTIEAISRNDHFLGQNPKLVIDVALLFDLFDFENEEFKAEPEMWAISGNLDNAAPRLISREKFRAISSRLIKEITENKGLKEVTASLGVGIR